MPTKRRECMICGAPLSIDNNEGCPVCQTHDPFMKMGNPFTYSDPLKDMLNSVKQGIENERKRRAEQKRQQGMKWMQMMQGAMNFTEGIQNLSENIQNMAQDGLDFGEMTQIASDSANLIAKTTGKGKNFALALDGFSGMSNALEDIQDSGINWDNAEQFYDSGLKFGAGATGNAKAYKKAAKGVGALEQMQEGVVSGDMGQFQNGMNTYNKVMFGGKKKKKDLPSGNITQRLKEIKELLDFGVISQEEFESKKKEYLKHL